MGLSRIKKQKKGQVERRPEIRQLNPHACRAGNLIPGGGGHARTTSACMCTACFLKFPSNTPGSVFHAAGHSERLSPDENRSDVMPLSELYIFGFTKIPLAPRQSFRQAGRRQTRKRTSALFIFSPPAGPRFSLFRTVIVKFPYANTSFLRPPYDVPAREREGERVCSHEIDRSITQDDLRTREGCTRILRV